MIKKNRTSPFISLLLLLALSLGSVTQASAQGTQRERRVGIGQPPAAATTTAQQTPKPTPTPKAVPTPAPQSTDSSLSRVVKPRVPAPKTLEELRAGIREVLRNPELESAQMAVKIASLDTGRTLFEENAEKLLHPASNMKIYTLSAALDRLGPDFRFKTSAYVPSAPD